ncbi:hypothetical protein [Halosegnis marinus]|uniref:Uncharacterized protein n=1 Tax=Halosegnis marinus TaxID=3034023 RepID=A0ABD5ZRL8_9EURY|nr:hypothetical protein [Halosegnis sp. DT85]
MATRNRPRVGIDHLTVVPTNFEPDDDEPAEAPAAVHEPDDDERD